MESNESKAKEKQECFDCQRQGARHTLHHRRGPNPTIKEQPVKSLGRLYAVPLTDRHRGVEIETIATKGLTAIDKSELPGKLKAWCFQHGLLPRLLWPLQVYEVSLSRVESIQRHISKHLRKWLGVPPCFSNVVTQKRGRCSFQCRLSRKSSRSGRLVST